jgi:hypothetical protein
MRQPRDQSFTYTTKITPIACPRCKAFARLIQRAPLPAGLEGEMCTLECKKCRKQTKIIVQDWGLYPQSSRGERRNNVLCVYRTARIRCRNGGPDLGGMWDGVRSGPRSSRGD